MTKSGKPRKSRKAFLNMPAHQRVKAIAAHVDKKISKELGRRSVSLRKGDTVKILRGDFRGKSGKVSDLNHSKMKIHIDKIVKKRSDGTEIHVPISPSNTIVTELDKSDAKRFGKKPGKEKKEK